MRYEAGRGSNPRIPPYLGDWLSWLERCLDMAEIVGSSPALPTSLNSSLVEQSVEARRAVGSIPTSSTIHRSITGSALAS